VPLRAGDCTFHHGRTAHYAGPNTTAQPRFAHAIIYMNADTRYNGARHVITDPLHLSPGDLLEGELFPLAADLSAVYTG
jgi:ectoine hydroxylase-related dioxygenase (phytanoyl-CoA dioxygenase family)